jgi:hypothetical protein
MMTENLALELEMLNLMKSMEHSHWAMQNLYFEVEIPLALEVSETADEKKLVEQEVELLVAQKVGHVKEVLELLKEKVMLKNAGMVQQEVGYLTLVEEVQMDH